MRDHKVIITVVTHGYSSFLLVPVWIYVAYNFFVRWGWRGVRKDQGIWNFFTTVPNLPDPTLRTDRRLLAVIVRYPSVWFQWYRLFNLSVCRYVLKLNKTVHEDHGKKSNKTLFLNTLKPKPKRGSVFSNLLRGPRPRAARAYISIRIQQS